jgi:hypothetical protein
VSLADDARLGGDARRCRWRRNEKAGCQKAWCVKYRGEKYLSECMENIRRGTCDRPAPANEPREDSP